MKGGATISLSVALALGAFVFPRFAQAANGQSDRGATSARQEAAQMVPATVNLKEGLDARKMHPGEHFQAVLQHDVQLKNGPRLEHGTMLLGTVTTDQTGQDGLRLALRFTQARMKNGQTIPIKATVFQIAQPQVDSGTNVADESGLWTPGTLRVDQENALSGVDLHSAVASNNSALLVSRKKDNVKLLAGSQMVLAIAAQNGNNRQSGSNGMIGGA